ncbi:uncharacterized protein LOC107620743 [Arachis ipaensis]|uniref:uncharacterized protein LOC107620743 n=1 Tax=Arachis ipaensis TaxID=130454 RepID=UPI0007AEF8FD|nr:uncharacterized protein LOC107620743 [Arachis ipaensis]
MEKIMRHQELTSKDHEALLQNLERQIGQLSKQTVAERAPNALPSDTIPNPKEECKVIHLRSARTLVNDKETDKRPTENDISSKKEVTLKEKDQEKLKEKEEQPQSSKKGSSINLMPMSMMRRLCIEEVKPTQMSLEPVDRSLVIPKGVIENLLVRVGKFIFPADFVILDLGEEGNDSIILGRPFLATARAIIDVEQGEMTLRVNDEKITLNVFQEVQHAVEEKSCMTVEEEDLQWKEKPNEVLINSPIK